MSDDHPAPTFYGEPLPSADDLAITRLGPAEIESPLVGRGERFVGGDERVLLLSDAADLEATMEDGGRPHALEAAGPRARRFFEPGEVSCGIVTCGGLCPGLNDVVRSVVLTLSHHYGVRRILGFRYGYAGLSSQRYRDPVFLDPDEVQDLHQRGGTVLGTSRGPQDVSDMVDTLVKWRVDILIAIGGDGTLKGASALAREALERNLEIAVVGIPKTIDNDLRWIERSFGFVTAVEEARSAVNAAHTEALAAWNGIGLVKLMGRHSGFIAAHASLASGDVNFCLVPEVPFDLEGEDGFLAALDDRLERRRHAVVVVAEGAGQELFERDGESRRDASGNIVLRDIGPFLRDRMRDHLSARGLDFTIKYIDPSYTIRSLPANALDSAFCLILGQHAVHAAMAGRTDLMVGWWNGRYTHVPLSLVGQGRKQMEDEGEVWQRVLDATGQPNEMRSPPEE